VPMGLDRLTSSQPYSADGVRVQYQTVASTDANNYSSTGFSFPYLTQWYDESCTAVRIGPLGPLDPSRGLARTMAITSNRRPDERKCHAAT
jgi:hypothetical protein